MTTPFDEAERNAHQFRAGLYTMHEIIQSVKEHNHATEMVIACGRHKDLEPGIKDFQDEVKEIEQFWVRVANIYASIGLMES